MYKCLIYIFRSYYFQRSPFEKQILSILLDQDLEDYIIMSCNCSCMCQGTWQVPQTSLPIHGMTFQAGNELHCATSPEPRHRLACNIPSNFRKKRSLEAHDDIDQFTDFEVWSIILVLVIIIVILCVILALLAFKYHKLSKKCYSKNNQFG